MAEQLAALGGKVPPRSDPKPRHIDATIPGTRLLNEDPKYAYCMVYLASEHSGPALYAERGWEICTQEDPKKNPDCLRFKQGLTVKPGDQMAWRGSVLMRILKSELHRQRREGVDGAPGLDQYGADLRRMRAEGGVPNDPMFAAIQTMGAQGFLPPDQVGADGARNETREIAVRERA